MLMIPYMLGTIPGGALTFRTVAEIHIRVRLIGYPAHHASMKRLVQYLHILRLGSYMSLTPLHIHHFLPEHLISSFSNTIVAFQESSS